MTNITFFFLLIPILAIVLLAVNFIFATHSPYQEKNSAFECGFHSFLGQNRMQFNISFYIFGLLFLLFDLEILLIYPYPVSAQFNSLYGLSVMLIFFLVLTVGFAFELGKNALKIDSRQYLDKNIKYKILESNLFKNIYVRLSNLITKNDFLFGLLASIITFILLSLIIKLLIPVTYPFYVKAILLLITLVTSNSLKIIIKSCLLEKSIDYNEIKNSGIKIFFIGAFMHSLTIISSPYIIVILSFIVLESCNKVVYCLDHFTEARITLQAVNAVTDNPDSYLRTLQRELRNLGLLRSDRRRRLYELDPSTSAFSRERYNLDALKSEIQRTQRRIRVPRRALIGNLLLARDHAEKVNPTFVNDELHQNIYWKYEEVLQYGNTKYNPDNN